MENLYRAQITVNGDSKGDPCSWLNFWNYPDAEGKEITLPYTFNCIVNAGSAEEAEKKCINNRH